MNTCIQVTNNLVSWVAFLHIHYMIFGLWTKGYFNVIICKCIFSILIIVNWIIRVDIHCLIVFKFNVLINFNKNSNNFFYFILTVTSIALVILRVPKKWYLHQLLHQIYQDFHHSTWYKAKYSEMIDYSRFTILEIICGFFIVWSKVCLV